MNSDVAQAACLAVLREVFGLGGAPMDGFKVMTVAEAAKWADVMMMLTPDELQGDIYREHLHDNMKKGARRESLL